MPRPYPLLHRVIFVCLVALAIPAFGPGCNCTCEECMSHGVQREVQHEEVKNYVYSAPLADTFEVLGALLSERGWERPEARPTLGGTLHAPRKGAMNDDEMLLRFIPVGKSRYRVEMERSSIYKDMDGGTRRDTNRDLDMEWELASRVDLAFAAKTEEKAEKARKRAAAVGRGCDKGCELGCRACETCDRMAGGRAREPATQ